MRLPLNFGNPASFARRLVQATVGGAGVRLAGMAATFLVGVQLARYLGPESYGVYGTVMALVSLLAVLAQLGLPPLLTRELSVHLAMGSPGRVGGALLWFTAIVCAASGLMAAIGGLGLHLWPGTADAAFSHAFYWGLASVPLMALTNLAIAALRGFHHVISAQLYDVLLRPSLLAVFLLVAAIAWKGIDAPASLALQALASATALVLCLWQLVRVMPRNVVEAAATRHGGEWVASAAPMMGTEVLRVLYGQYAVLLLGLLAPIEDVGVFRAALAVAGLIGLPATLVNLVVMPYAAQLHASGDRARLQLVASGSAVAMFAATGILTLGSFLFGETFLAAVFGPAFADAAWPLSLMGLAYVVNGFFGSAATILNMCGQERVVTGAYAVGPLLGIVLTVALFGTFGIAAAAIAMVVAEIVKGVWMTRAARRALSIDPSLMSGGALLSIITLASVKPEGGRG